MFIFLFTGLRFQGPTPDIPLPSTTARTGFRRVVEERGGKADLVFWLFHEDLAGLAQMHRDLEGCFPPGTIDTVYSYLSVTELTEYQPTEDDLKARAQREFKLEEGTPEFEAKLVELVKWKADYEKFRLYPEMPDWEIMCFYPMLKKRQGEDNWYMLDFDTRKKLMRTHAVTGRKFAGRIKQLITGSSGLDDWEWGVTLMAQQLDAVKEIVYEMRLDEVSAKYAEFGPFYINLRLEPEAQELTAETCELCGQRFDVGVLAELR